MKRIIGIDLGTTNSAMAYMEGDEPRIIPNDRGNRITPSVVAFTDGEPLIGEAAKNQAVINPERTIFAVKRKMGTGETIHISGNRYSSEQVSALILEKLKGDAESYLGEEVAEAVITVPAYFNERQRKCTKEAASIAGLRVRRILNEPTAAAMAYACKTSGERNVLVYDMGGGTFDVSILESSGNHFAVKAICGDNHLGGIDFDEMIMREVLSHFEAQSGVRLSGDKVMRQQLQDQVEMAKIELSSRESVLIALPFISGSRKPIHLTYTLERSKFEEMIRSSVERTVKLSRQAIRDSGHVPSDIDGFILSGGSSRIPLVRRQMCDLVSIPPDSKINPEEVVALGAAVCGSMLGRTGSGSLRDATPYPLGVEIDGGRFIEIISKNCPIPTSRKRIFTTVSNSQNAVEIHVLQGFSVRAAENTSLGRFLLSGIRKAQRGEPRIDVIFTLDADGILHVTAKDSDTGVSQKVSLTGVDGNGAKDLGRANKGSSESTRSHEGGKLRNRVLSLAVRVESTVATHRSSFDVQLRREAEEIVWNARTATEGSSERVLSEHRLALETLIGELEAILAEFEVDYGRA